MTEQPRATHGECPVTERVSECLVRLPFDDDLSVSGQDKVIRAIREFDCRKPVAA